MNVPQFFERYKALTTNIPGFGYNFDVKCKACGLVLYKGIAITQEDMQRPASSDRSTHYIYNERMAIYERYNMQILIDHIFTHHDDYLDTHMCIYNQVKMLEAIKDKMPGRP